MSALGHSRPRHSAPGPTNVRCYSNSGHTRVRLERAGAGLRRRFRLHATTHPGADTWFSNNIGKTRDCSERGHDKTCTK